MTDTSNRFMVRATTDDSFLFETKTRSAILCRVTRAEALNLAAWLQVMADPGGEEIARLVAELKK